MYGFEGSQSVPARPSGKSRLRAKGIFVSKKVR